MRRDQGSGIRGGFTLIELLVVVAMLAVLMGALTSSVGQARKRAKIAKAMQDVKEITNAILAYQNFAPKKFATMASDSWKETKENDLGMILGKGMSDENEQVPVLYNAQIKGGVVKDPWGTPYQFMIKRLTAQASSQNNLNYITAPNLPNFYRLTDEERQ